jgi:hypothetical protein
MQMAVGRHVARMDAGKWAYITTTWDPRTGKRKKGRLRHRWAQLFKAAVRPEWTRIARNRVMERKGVKCERVKIVQII